MRAINKIQESAKDFAEVKLRRTSHSKTYHIENKTFRTYQTITQQHWYDESSKELRTIDLTPIDKGDHWVIDKAPYTLTVNKTTLAVTYISKKGGTTKINLKKIGTTDFNETTVTAELLDSGIRFNNIEAGLDLELRIRPDGIEWYKILHNDTVATTFEWEVQEDKDITTSHRPVAIGRDAANNGIELLNNKIELSDKDGMTCYKLVERFTGRVKKVIDPKTRIKGWSTEVSYPVTIDVPDVTENVLAAEDGHAHLRYTEYYYWGDPSSGTPVNVTAGVTNMSGAYDMYFGHTGYATHSHPVHLAYGHKYFVNLMQRNMVFRFTTVAIPVSSVISLAEFKVRVISISGSGTSSGKIKGIDEDNVAVQSSSNKWKGKTKTTASTSLPALSTTGTKTFDVTDVVQEIVDRAGWANNNAMGMFMSAPTFAEIKPIIDPAAATGFTINKAFNENVGLEAAELPGSNEAVLEVTFELASGNPQVNFIG